MFFFTVPFFSQDLYHFLFLLVNNHHPHIFCIPLIIFQNLNNLLDHYLEPLKRETFLSSAEIAALFGNIQEIFTFQRQFLQNLEEALELEPEFHKFDHSSHFKVSFLMYDMRKNFSIHRKNIKGNRTLCFWKTEIIGPQALIKAV